MGLECLGARLVPTAGMTWGRPRSYGRNDLGHASFVYGRNIDVGLQCLAARLVPTVGMTWGTPGSYGRNDLGHASFLR